MKRLFVVMLLTVMLMSWFGIIGPAPKAQAQPDLVEGVQHIEGTVDSDIGVYYDLFGLQAGQTVYIYAHGLDGFDTYIALGDIDFLKVLAEDDDGGDDTDSALSYDIPVDGDYSIWIGGYDKTLGDFVLMIGVDAPEVLTGESEPTGDEIAVLYRGNSSDADNMDIEPLTPPPGGELVQGVQHFEGSITKSDGVYYDLFGLRAGQTVYFYAHGIDGFDTYLSFADIDFAEELTFDDDGGEDTDAALSYVIPQDGDYSVWIGGYDENATGDYLLIIGLDAPEVLTGEAEPTGDVIAELYTWDTGDTGEADVPPPPTVAGDLVQGVQRFEGAVTGSDGVYYDLFDLRAGQTVYFYAHGIDGFDTYLSFGDIDFEEVFASNDDGGNDTDAALSYVIREDGDYSVWVVGYEDGSIGDYELTIGVDAPEALTGEAEPTGDTVAVLYGPDLNVTDCSVLETRPELSGPEEIRETQNFIIHFTLSGSDGTSIGLVSEMMKALEGTWEYYINREGWPPPPRDCGEGGDDRFDVYVMEILDAEEVLGYVQPEALVGDNPFSEEIEEWASYSYLVLDNDFNGVGGDPFALMRTTVSHEFMHNLQFGYDINEPFDAIYESTATWMETQVFPEDEDATTYVGDYFALPELCIGSTDDSLRQYGEWLLIDSLVQDFGPQIIREMWQQFAVEEDMDAFYNYLAKLGTTPQEAIERLAVRNLLRRYDLADKFDADLFIEGVILQPGVVQPAGDGVQELGVNYLRIAAPGRYDLALNQPDISMIVVGITQDGQAEVYHLGNQGIVDTTAYQYAYIILLNTRQHTNAHSCTYLDWELTVTPSEAVAVVSTGEAWDASNFRLREFQIVDVDGGREEPPQSTKDQRRN